VWAILELSILVNYFKVKSILDIISMLKSM
jgi:hypothetical protein